MSWHTGEVSGTRLRTRRAAALPGPLRRAATVGIVGAAVTVSGLAGAGHASAAEPVVVDTCTGEASSSAFGQTIVASPEALDAKVEQAALLAFPLQFDLANEARQQFLETAPVKLGTVTEQDQDFSGTELADALAPAIADLPAFGDRGDTVNWHVRNLAALGCISGADVAGQEKPPPQPPPTSQPERTPEPQPVPPPEPAPTGRSAQQDTGAGPNTGAEPTPSAPAPAPSDPDFTPAPAKRVVPPDYAYVPGSLPPWSNTRFGQAPGQAPAVGDLGKSDRDTEVRERKVRAAGSAEALPGEPGNRVALPVLLAAISLAGVTSALVRTWVLRRG